MRPISFVSLLAFFLLAFEAPAFSQLTPFPSIPFERLKDRDLQPLGKAALAIRPNEWKHAETEHFVYHFFNEGPASALSTEAEVYYRVIAEELGKDTSKWERKCHIYIFDRAADWTILRASGGLEPWTGGLHANGELFLHRDPGTKFKGTTLAHEITHLVMYRFVGPGVPLWLNEGFAEYTGMKCYATFLRTRGYAAKPVTRMVSETAYIPLPTLTGYTAYPSDPVQVGTFYRQSERLVRFLAAKDKSRFLKLLEEISKGARFESALQRNFGLIFSSVNQLEAAFKPYATQPFALQ